MISNKTMDIIRGSGGGGCFLEDTSVLTPEGNVSIQDIEVNDHVICYDAYGTLFISKVLGTNSHLYKDVYEYTLWGGQTINATPNHWVLNSENAFSEIGKITESLCLVTTTGNLLPIVSKKYLGKFKVYNLIVDVHHTYIANGIRVHNGGGGKDEGRAPVEDPDNLKSISYAQVLDLLCEGEIEGLVDGAKSIFLDDTRLQNIDGSFAFEGVTWDHREGTQDQTPMSMFSAIEATTAIQTAVTNENPCYVPSIVDPIVDAIRVGIAIPQLMEQKTDTGDLIGASVSGAIEIKRNGIQVSYNPFTITGKTTSKFVFNKTYQLPRQLETDYFDIVITRTSAAPTSVYKNEFWAETYTKIITSQLKYPNSALVGIKINSANFSSIPTRGYHVKLLKIRIPTNYNPITRLYNRLSSGVLATNPDGSPIEQLWDGTFYTAWSNNPAWCLYDLITSTRYGLGEYIDKQYIDKWSLYSIARYCDILVPDGHGGLEPRFVLNTYIQTREDAIKVLNDISSSFRGMMYWSAGVITAVQDAGNEDPLMQFNNSNVINGTFEYSSASNKVVHNAAIVTWNDPNLNYKQRLEYVEDREGIEQYGYNPAEFISFGTTSRGQAHRAGKWLLYTEKVESSVVAFKAALESVHLRPGVLIKVHDDLRNGAMSYIRGGRVASVSGNVVQLDRPIVLDHSYTYSIRVSNYSSTILTYNITNTTDSSTIALSTDISTKLVFKDTVWTLYNASGVKVDTGIVKEATTTKLLELDKVVSITGAGYTLKLDRTITNTELFSIIESNGTVTEVTSKTTLPPDIGPNSLWTITSSQVVEDLYKVLSIKESSETGIYDILGVKHDRHKFEYVEDDKDLLDTDIYSTLVNAAYPVMYEGITLLDSIYINTAGQIQTLLSIGFSPSLYGAYYDVYLKKGDDSWKKLVDKSQHTEFTEYNVVDNERYRVKVVARNLLGREATATIYPALAEPGFLVKGKLRPPANVTNLQLFNQGSYVRLDWDPVTDLDLGGYVIKSGTTLDTWETAGLIANAKSDVFDAIPSVYNIMYSIITADTNLIKTDSVEVTASGRNSLGSSIALISTDSLLKTNAANIDTTGSDASNNSTIRYFIKAIDTSGNESITAAVVDFKIELPGTPTLAVTIIGNTVELTWTSVKTTLDIDHYNIYQGTPSNLVASAPASSYTKYINWQGDTTFWVSAVDIGNNISLPSNAVNVVINPPVFSAPPEFSVQGTNLRIDWHTAEGTLPIKEVELRAGGSSWVLGSTLMAKTSSSYAIIPINWLGGRAFRLKVYDIVGNASAEYVSVFTVLVPAAPAIGDALFSKLDSSLILGWSDSKTTLAIDYYEIREGVDWVSATPIGKIYALESTLPINWLDNEGIYLIRAVDILGNISPVAMKVVNIQPYGPVGSFSYSYTGAQLLLKWSEPIISGSMALDHYELWDGNTTTLGNEIVNAFATEALIPVTWDTSKIIWVIPVDTKGIKGTATYIDVPKATHSSVTGLVANIVGNNVEVSWAESISGSLAVKYYTISKGMTYPGVELTKVNSTNYTYPIDFIGSTKFWVTPVDINPINAYAGGSEAATGIITVNRTPQPIIDSAGVVGTKVAVSWHSAPHMLPISSYIIKVNGVEYTTTNSDTIRIPIPYGITGNLSIEILAKDTSLILDYTNISLPASVVVPINIPAAPVINLATSGFSQSNFIIQWDEVSNSIPIEDYEIGFGVTVLARQKTNTFSASAQWIGPRTFWVRAIDVLGNRGSISSITLTVNQPSAVAAFTSQVVDNNILLYWGAVESTLPINTYEIRQGPTWEGVIKLIGTKSGNFTSLFETNAGTYTYWIAAIDSAGNYGIPKYITSEVNQPPDYILKDNQALDFTQVINPINVVLDTAGHVIMPVSNVDTWQSHFTDRNWQSPADQVADQFNLYVQPSMVEGSFEYVIDYQTVFSSIKVTVVAGYTVMSGSPSIRCDIYTSLTGLAGSWGSPYQDTWSILAENFRYIKYVITVISAKEGTYTQNGNVISVLIPLHGFNTGASIFADFITGAAAGVDENNYIISNVTVSSFDITVPSSRSIVTPGNIIIHSTGQDGIINIAGINVKLDAKLRTLTGHTYCTAPITGTYTQTGTSLVVNCAAGHGISINDLVELSITSGNATSIPAAVVTASGATSITCTALTSVADTGGVIINPDGNPVYMTLDRVPNSPKEFIDIDAISLSPNSTTPSIAVYNFVDTPNPEFFKILLFNTAGGRIAGTCSYTVRGF